MTWALAERACLSAGLLLADGDLRGAANRAYYAMFYGARVGLLELEPTLTIPKRHKEIVGRFSKYAALGHGFDPEMGSAINRAFRLRMAADYKFGTIDLTDVREVVDDAAAFLAALTAPRSDATP